MSASTRWLLLLAAMLLVGWADQIHAQGLPQTQAAKELVAVLPFEAVGTNRERALAVSDRVREHLLGSGRFRLVERELINKILEEQALQQSGCTSQECAVQVGKILGVRKMVTGRLTYAGERDWILAASIIDVETGELVRVASVDQKGEFLAVLGESAPRLALRLAGEDTPTTAGRAPASKSPTLDAADPRTGLGVGGAYSQLNGVQELTGKSKYGFSLAVASVQIDYTWAARPPFTLSIFVQASQTSTIEDLKRIAGPADTRRLKSEAFNVAGGEAKYWFRNAYYAGVAVGVAYDEFEITTQPTAQAPKAVRKDLLGSGNLIALSAGWQHASGVYVTATYQRTEVEFSQGKHAYSGLGMNIGYRFQ